jgi:nucleotide-binding universal stress UspA family protein
MEATVLNVWSLSFPLPKSLVATVEEQYSRELAEVGFKARARSERGHPATVILESAQRQHAQLLVVGARGLSGLKRFLLGSVSHRIVKYSASSVLVVKES